MSFDYDAFLSYNREDAAIVEAIATRLAHEAGLRVFLDKWCLIPGEAWQDEIEDALDRSATCVVFVGPHGPSPWAHIEMRAALELRAKERMLRVIPTLLPGVDKDNLPLFLKSLTWVDYTAGQKDDKAFETIKAGVCGYSLGATKAPLTSEQETTPQFGTLIVDSLLPVADFQSRPELNQLRSFWVDDSRSGVMALIGIGGSGKTALVCRLLQEIPNSGVVHRKVLKNTDLPSPQGVFVWSFYDRPDVELFMQALYGYFAGKESGAGPARDLTYRLIRQLENSRLSRVLIVLDGLEVVQESQDSSGGFGILRDSSLRHLVRHFAQGGLGIRVIMTSRFPFPDLLTFQGMGYWFIDTDNLDQSSARNLLRSRGVRGTEMALDELIKDYGNHALTLDHLGTLLKDFFDGDPRRARELPPIGTARGDAYAEYQAYRLARVFSFYEEHLPSIELKALGTLCVFRVPVSLETVIRIFANDHKNASPAIPRLKEVTIRSVLAALRSRRLISFYGDRTETTCSVHPAIRDHFYRAMGATSADIHAGVREHLIPLALRPGRERLPLDPFNLDLMEEYIYHSTRSGRSQEALRFYETNMGGYTHFAWRLGDYQRGLRITSIFVDAGGIELEADRFNTRPWLDRSLFHLDLGRPSLAESQLRELLVKRREEIELVNQHRKKKRTETDEDVRWHWREFGSIPMPSDPKEIWLYYEAMLLQSLCDALVAQGKLVEAQTTADFVIDNGSRKLWGELRFETGSNPFGRRAVCKYFLGNVSGAISDFSKADAMYGRKAKWNHEATATPLPGRYDIAFHALLLGRLGRFRSALNLLHKSNLAELREMRPLLGAQYELALSAVHLDSTHIGDASQHIDSALAWAIQSGHQEVYTRATLAKARVALRSGNLQEARRMLREAEQIARASSFKIWLVDVLVVAGYLALRDGDLKRAAEVGNEAFATCKDPSCGYAWGRGDAAHLIAQT